MLRGIWGDPERYRDTYWSRFDGPLLRRRRRQDRRRRLPLAARPGRRRHERLRPPHLHHRGGVAPWSTTRRWPRRRWSAPTTTLTGQAIVGYVILAGHAPSRPTSWARRSASTWPPRSARPPGPRRSSSPRPAQDPLAARSCAACSATWPRAATWATPPPWPTRRRRGDPHRRGRRAQQRPVIAERRPGNWLWRSEPVSPGPAVVFDMDGVLSDAAGRQHFLERPVSRLGRLLRGVRRRRAHRRGGPAARGARPRPARGPAHRPPVTGPAPDPRLARALRAALGPAGHARLGRLRGVARASSAEPWASCAPYGFDLQLAFEDDRRNVDMFHGEGVPCVYIHSGYYD